MTRKFSGLQILNVRAQCCHYDDRHFETTRCQTTSAHDPLAWHVPEQYGRYCEQHGPITLHAIRHKEATPCNLP